MYFLSSFFNQFGPNSATFLVAAEMFPTPIRATAHGFSAATKFYVVPWFGLVGAVLTSVFLPDTTGLDLKEQERRWSYIRTRREQDHHSVAIHSRHLPLWERYRGIGELQRRARLPAEGRGDVQRLEKEEAMDGFADDDEFSSDVSTCFLRTQGTAGTSPTCIIPPRRGGDSSQDSVDRAKVQ
ncbi:hypothetical protein BJ546DRAFT_1064423 [Cryomyces antarcticus]